MILLYPRKFLPSLYPLINAAVLLVDKALQVVKIVLCFSALFAIRYVFNINIIIFKLYVQMFCGECDLFVHETLHTCPGCAGRPARSQHNHTNGNGNNGTVFNGVG